MTPPETLAAHRDEFVGFVARRLGNRELAEDLVHSVLAHAVPRVDVVREEPALQGARFVHVGTDRDTTRNALATSESRRKLFEEGKYIPRGYMLIWARKHLLGYSVPAT